MDKNFDDTDTSFERKTLYRRNSNDLYRQVLLLVYGVLRGFLNKIFEGRPIILTTVSPTSFVIVGDCVLRSKEHVLLYYTNYCNDFAIRSRIHVHNTKIR